MSRVTRQLSLFFILFSFLFLTASATPGYSAGIFFSTNPAYPKPNSEVTVSIRSFSVDLREEMIQWVVDGKTVHEGIGQMELLISTKGLGVPTKIEVIVDPKIPEPERGELIIIPSTVDLLWEAETYIPDWYEGKALYSERSGLRIVAVPRFVANGKPLNPASLTYQWNMDGKKLVAASGDGKNVLDLPQTTPTRQTVWVLVSTNDATQQAWATITIEPREPHIMLYEDRPLAGIQHGSILPDSFYFSAPEITVRAEPFYFEQGVTEGSVSWNINGETFNSNEDQPFSFTFGRGRDTGQARVTASVKHRLQSALRSFTILFGTV